MGLLVPLATGVLFSDVIPNAEIPLLTELTAALVLAAIGKAAFELTRAIAVLRMEGKANAALQAAIWDRLLRLPTTFFRRYTAGDLAMRAMGIDAIRQVLSGVTVTAAISGAFSLVNFAMMFYYDGRLTVAAVGLLIVFLGLTTLLNLHQLRSQCQAYETEGKVAGLLLQLLNGIAKLRVANVEARAFNVWAKLFSTQRSFLFQGRSIANMITVINSIFPLFSSMALFAYVAWKLESLSIGEFLVFNAAYGQFLASTLAMGAAFTSSLVIGPLCERLTQSTTRADHTARCP